MIDEFCSDSGLDDPSASTVSLSSVATKYTANSTVSHRTFLPRQGGYGGQLQHLCSLIATHTSLQHATIVSSECYWENIAFRIVHRFLIFELAREGKKPIWLRVDRRRSRTASTFEFIYAGGSTPSNDTVRLLSTTSNVI